MLGSIVEVIAARRSEEDAREGALSYRGHIFCSGGDAPVRREAFVLPGACLLCGSAGKERRRY